MKDPLVCTNHSGLSVVVPVFNEEHGLHELIRRLTPVCERLFNRDYEILLVNDGSTDQSWQVITSFVDASPNVVGINLSRNFGHQLALSAGLSRCRGDYVFVLDADLQDPPELLAEMLAKMREGHDVVYGQRIGRAGETIFKKASANLFYRLLGRVVSVDIPYDAGDFRLMTRRVVTQLNAMPENYRFVRGMVGWVGFSQAPLPYQRDARFADETHYPLRKMIRFALEAITSFSVLPLRFASVLGLIFGVLGLLALGWVGTSWLLGGTVVGWTSLAALVLILGSVQLMMLGVFGEYLGQLYMESKRRPLFVIQEIRAQSALVSESQPL